MMDISDGNSCALSRVDERSTEGLSQERLRIALQAGRMGLWTYNLKTGEQEWDRRQREILGVDATTPATREVFLSLVLPEDRANIELGPGDLTPGAFQDGDFRIRRPDGKIRWISSHSLTRVDENGEPIELVGVNRDITAQKTEELERHQAEHRLELATTAAKIGIWHWDVLTGEFYYSPQARAIYGFQPDEIITYDKLQQRTHPDDYRYVDPAVRRALDPRIRQQEVLRYRISRADNAEERWILAHGGAEFSGPGPEATAVSYTGTIQDITSEVEFESRLRDEQARLSLALAAADLAVWELDIASNKITSSPELNRLYRFAEGSSPSFEELSALYAPGERERVEAQSAAAFAAGETTIRFEAKYRWPDGLTKWIAVRAQVILDDQKRPTRVIGVAMDVTPRRQSEEQLAVVARELQHRVKNSLTIVQSIARQSFRGARSKEEGLEVFTGRLRALSAATDLMTTGNWQDVPLREVVDEIIRPYGADRFTVSGTPVRIPSQQATTLGMALHELCTNAVKYGSLSTDTGIVSISWVVDRGLLEIDWVEQGGPPVAPPKTNGFGTRLLRQGLFSESGGGVTIKYDPAGLRCTLKLRTAAADA